MVFSDCRIRCLLEFAFVLSLPGRDKGIWLFFKSMFLEPAGSVSNSELALVAKWVCLAIIELSS